MDDVVQISQVDRERIEQEVAQFRKTLERQYAMAYLQGQIDCANETRIALTHPIVTGDLATQRRIHDETV